MRSKTELFYYFFKYEMRESRKFEIYIQHTSRIQLRFEESGCC